MQVRIAGLIKESIVDGPGIRFVVFTQGCLHHCDGCHNLNTHALDGGQWMDVADIIAQTENLPLMKGITISGGEPFLQPDAVHELIRLFKELHPKCDVIIYSGYTYEELICLKNDAILHILAIIDYLIDGRFEIKLRNLELHFRGSTNQRIIDLKKSRQSQTLQIVNW